MEFVTKATVAFDGADESNFQEFTENEIVLGKVVELMNKTGFGGNTPRYGFMLKYVVPSVGARDWKTVRNVTCTVVYDNGETVIFTGCYVLSVGQGVTNGTDETTKDITFFATERREA